MISKEQQNRLNEDLPSGAIREREGSSGRSLSYLEGWYVMDRMNAILGPGGWSYDCTTNLVVNAHAEDVLKSGAKVWRWHITYTAKCVLTVGDCKIGDFGAGHGLDKDAGAAHESAIKEACTDAFKRCAKSLGRSMGLALYSKEREHVYDGPVTDTSDAAIDAIVAELDAAKTVAGIERAREMYKAIDDASPAQDARVKAAGVAAKKRTGAA